MEYKTTGPLSEQEPEDEGYTFDRNPIIDPPEVEPGPPRTYETDQQEVEEARRQHEVEEGVVSENELLRESVVSDNELAVENMENDNP